MQQLTRDQFLKKFKQSLSEFEDAISTDIQHSWADEPSKYSQDLEDEDWLESLANFHRHKTLD